MKVAILIAVLFAVAAVATETSVRKYAFLFFIQHVYDHFLSMQSSGPLLLGHAS